VEINLKDLNHFKKGSTIDPKSLVDAGLVTQKELATKSIKILGTGTLDIALTVNIPTSKSAADKIQKAGGKVGREQIR
jgi:ribosomal protein L15